MKLKELKDKLNQLNNEQLEQNFIVTAYKEIFGTGEICIAEEDYIYDGYEEQPYLNSKENLLLDYTENEINKMSIIIPKGTFFINLPIK